jgi:hypothetical protein
MLRGIGPTMIPRPQRMYLRFSTPIDTAKPQGISEEEWVATIKQKTQDTLERTLAELLEVRSNDPYRALNPLAWTNAVQSPKVA